MKKNVASQKWRVFAFNVDTGLAKTGDAANISAKISKDFGAFTATNDAAPTELESGYYAFDMLQEETNADNLALIPVSSTASIQVLGCPFELVTVAENFGDLVIQSGGAINSVGTVNTKTGYSLAASSLTSGTLAAGAINAAALSGSAGSEIGTAVWATGTRALTDKAGFSLAASSLTSGTLAAGAINAAALSGSAGTEIGTAVWAHPTKTVGTVNVTVTNSDMRGTDSASTHSAADVWAVATRAITDKAGFSLATNQRTVHIATVSTVNVTVTNSDMRGTDGANTVVPPSVAQFNARTLVAASYFDPSTDTVQIGGTSKTGYSLAASSLTSGTMAAGAFNAAAISSTAGAKLADISARRTLANIEASSDGDAVSLRSQYGAAAKLTNKVAVSGTTLTVYKSDDSTALGTQSVTTQTTGQAITALDTD